MSTGAVDARWVVVCLLLLLVLLLLFVVVVVVGVVGLTSSIALDSTVTLLRPNGDASMGLGDQAMR